MTKTEITTRIEFLSVRASRARDLVVRAIENGVHAVLLTGSADAPKDRVAREVAEWALGRWPRAADLDFLELAGTARIGIEEVRAVTARLSKKPVAAPRSV